MSSILLGVFFLSSSEALPNVLPLVRQPLNATTTGLRTWSELVRKSYLLLLSITNSVLDRLVDLFWPRIEISG
jgi:hypothetical protein